MDFSRRKLSGRFYGGTEKKIGIKISGQNYMLKFQKRSEFGPCFNHVSEYIGSHVFEYLGFEVQETILGTYNGENVVACRDFTSPKCLFVPFNDVGESSLEQDKEQYRYTYEDIMLILEDNRKLTDVDETISVFWRMFIVDALLGNFDRHGANWGFLKENNKYRLSPIFDNGSCLYPKLSNENDMLNIISSNEETEERVYGFPNSQIKIGRHKSSYYDVIHCLSFEECNKALLDIFPRIDLLRIDTLIDCCDVSEVRKRFYSHMIRARYDKILKSSFEELTK